MTAKKTGNRRPAIKSIEILGHVPSGYKNRETAAGSVLLVTGKNFGSKPGGARILFDEIETYPFASPYSRDELVVTAPLPKSAVSTVRVSVRGLGVSAPYKFKILRPQPNKSPSGTAMLELLQAIDEQGALTAQFVRLVASLPNVNPSTKQQLSIAADGIDGSRLAAQRVYEVWMQWAPLQEPELLEPMKTIALIDEIIITSGLTELVRRGTDGLFGLGGLVDDFLPEGIGQLISELDLGELAEKIIENFDIDELLKKLREIGGFIGENVISLEGIEDVLKFVKPSIEGGASVVIQGSLDVEFDIAQIISGIAEFLGLGGEAVEGAGGVSTQISELSVIVDELVGLVNRLEAKEDLLTTKIQDLDERTKKTSAEVLAIEQMLGLLGELVGGTLVGQRWILDDRITRTEPNITPPRDVKLELHDIEDAVKRLEEKDDRQEEKLDRLEEKLDREEEKLDRFGSLELPQEGAIASQRDGANRVTGAVTAVRTSDNSVHLRSAINVTRRNLAEEAQWTDWVDFGRPRRAAQLQTVSLDLQYEDESNSRMTALLSARDARGNVFHREFQGPQDADLQDPARWGVWRQFLRQP